MPTYEYECDACGHAFEEFQYMSDAPLKKCPSCGKKKLNRLIGAGAGIIFKGSGFYETDYKRKESPKPASSEASSSAGSAKKDAPAKTESKPAAKSDSSSAKAS